MTEPWRSKARVAFEARLLPGFRPNGDSRPHYVVCGQDPLAYQLVTELLKEREAVRVTVIAPARRRPDVPDIRKLRGIRLVKADRLDEAAFRAAGLVNAQGLALMDQNDVGNIHAALCAKEVAPEIRLVIRMFNTDLGYGVKRLFAHCEVMSDATMAAPAFVAAALGEVAPAHFSHLGRTLFVARRKDVRQGTVVCGLADTSDPAFPKILPDDQQSADLVLADASGQATGTELAVRRLARLRRQHRRRRPITVLLRAVRSFVTRKIGIATLSVLAVMAVFGALLAHAQNVNLWQAVYVTLIMALSGADPAPENAFQVQAMQVVLTIAGMALIPLLTAAVVDGIVNARLALDAGRLHALREDHIVVVGLGNVGTRVIRQLTELGIEVVAVDKNPDARGAATARRLDIPFVVADAAQEETLRLASIEKAQAMVVVSTDDVSNLQAALHAHAIKPDLRVVLRLFDGDLAERIQRAFNIGISRSVSHLAAPAFAAALLDRDVIATLPVERQALLVADVQVAPGASLIGQRIAAVRQPQGLQVIALTRKEASGPHWSPGGRERIRAGDRLTVVARKASLGWLLKKADAPPPVPPQPDRGAGTPVPRSGEGTPT